MKKRQITFKIEDWKYNEIEKYARAHGFKSPHLWARKFIEQFFADENWELTDQVIRVAEYTELIRVYLTPEQKNRVRRKAEVNDQSISNYARDKIFDNHWER